MLIFKFNYIVTLQLCKCAMAFYQFMPNILDEICCVRNGSNSKLEHPLQLEP